MKLFFFPPRIYSFYFPLFLTCPDSIVKYRFCKTLVPKIGGAELLRGNDVQFLYFHYSCHSEENSLICDIIPYYYYIPLHKRGH